MKDETRATPDVDELSRRKFLRGTAVVGIALGAEAYVKPALRTIGVTRLNAAASTPVRRPPSNNDQDGHSGQNGQGDQNHQGQNTQHGQH